MDPIFHLGLQFLPVPDYITQTDPLELENTQFWGKVTADMRAMKQTVIS